MAARGDLRLAPQHHGDERRGDRRFDGTLRDDVFGAEPLDRFADHRRPACVHDTIDTVAGDGIGDQPGCRVGMTAFDAEEQRGGRNFDPLQPRGGMDEFGGDPDAAGARLDRVLVRVVKCHGADRFAGFGGGGGDLVDCDPVGADDQHGGDVGVPA